MILATEGQGKLWIFGFFYVCIALNDACVSDYVDW